jgi:hypothetical protein
MTLPNKPRMRPGKDETRELRELVEDLDSPPKHGDVVPPSPPAKPDAGESDAEKSKDRKGSRRGSSR